MERYYLSLKGKLAPVEGLSIPRIGEMIELRAPEHFQQEKMGVYLVKNVLHDIKEIKEGTLEASLPRVLLEPILVKN